MYKSVALGGGGEIMDRMKRQTKEFIRFAIAIEEQREGIRRLVRSGGGGVMGGDKGPQGDVCTVDCLC